MKLEEEYMFAFILGGLLILLLYTHMQYAYITLYNIDWCDAVEMYHMCHYEQK